MTEPRADLPTIGVVIATRDRGDVPARAVGSVLANRYPRLGVTVVDQSGDGSTEAALEPFFDDPRLRYRRSATVGLARAHNLGIDGVAAEIVAITDDDCDVPSDWVARIADAFAGEDRLALVFGDVRAGPHDAAAGFARPAVGEQGGISVAEMQMAVGAWREAENRVGCHHVSPKPIR